MSTRLTRIHIAPRTSGVPVVSFIMYAHGKEEGDDMLFSSLPKGFQYTTFTLDSGAEEADYILAPHPVRSMDAQTVAYVDTMRAYAKRFNKPLIVFGSGDYHHKVFFDGVIFLKGSQYGYLKRDNEIVIPCFVEDLSEQMPLVIRKKSPKPVVGFCGFSSFATPVLYLKYLIKNLAIDVITVCTGRRWVRTQKRGIYWRRKAMGVLRRDSRIETQFLMRRSFSGSAELVSVDPAQARRDYLENMRDCDFALTPKGDANISFRFYEALSMGRIPILIDTDVILPGEEYINYDDCILRVPYTEINRLADIVVDFYAQLSDEKFVEMQKAARRAYEQYLRYDVFLNTLFTRILPPLSRSH